MHMKPQDFIVTELHELLNRQIGPVQIVFITGNTVLGCEEGIIPVEAVDLNIAIQYGYCTSVRSSIELEGTLLKSCVPAHEYDNGKRYGGMQNDCILSMLNVPVSTPVIAIVYGGKTEFQEATICAQVLKQSRDNVHVFFLTCDCEISSKRIRLEQMVEKRLIDNFIITRLCGGDRDLRYILVSLVKYWQATH